MDADASCNGGGLGIPRQRNIQSRFREHTADRRRSITRERDREESDFRVSSSGHPYLFPLPLLVTQPFPLKETHMSTITAQQPSNSVPEAVLQADATVTRNPQEILLQTGLAYIASACLNTAVKLGIPDLIGSGSKDVDVLAPKSGTDPDYLFRVLRVLEVSQIVVRTASRSYKLTDAGQLLRRGVPGSMSDCIEWIADPLYLKLYSEMKRSVEQGRATLHQV